MRPGCQSGEPGQSSASQSVGQSHFLSALLSDSSQKTKEVWKIGLESAQKAKDVWKIRADKIKEVRKISVKKKEVRTISAKNK